MIFFNGPRPVPFLPLPWTKSKIEINVPKQLQLNLIKPKSLKTHPCFKCLQTSWSLVLMCCFLCTCFFFFFSSPASIHPSLKHQVLLRPIQHLGRFAVFLSWVFDILCLCSCTGFGVSLGFVRMQSTAVLDNTTSLKMVEWAFPLR